jgi:hypothetical protein
LRENDYSPLVNNKGGLEMNLSPPTTVVFVVSLILWVLAIISTLVPTVPFVSDNAFWVAAVAYFILALGNVLRGM